MAPPALHPEVPAKPQLTAVCRATLAPFALRDIVVKSKNRYQGAVGHDRNAMQLNIPRHCRLSAAAV